MKRPKTLTVCVLSTIKYQSINKQASLTLYFMQFYSKTYNMKHQTEMSTAKYHILINSHYNC